MSNRGVEGREGAKLSKNAAAKIFVRIQPNNFNEREKSKKKKYPDKIPEGI